MISAEIPKELVEELEQRFPQKCPKPTETTAQIFYYAGQAELVSYMRASYEEQNNTAININVLRSLECRKGE